jgi:hypothetical protein
MLSTKTAECDTKRIELIGSKLGEKIKVVTAVSFFFLGCALSDLWQLTIG